MKAKTHVIVAGTGHLSLQVSRRLREKSFDVRRVLSGDGVPGGDDRPVYERVSSKLVEANISDAEAVFVVDDDDQQNIEFFLIASSLVSDAHIYVSLFNEALAPHLAESYAKLTVFSPAATAAPMFVEAIERDAGRNRSRRRASAPALPYKFDVSKIIPVGLLTALFLLIVTVATLIFHETKSLSWLDAVYFSVAVITTTGFGDFNLSDPTPTGTKIFGTLLMLVGVGFISIVFSLIVDMLLTHRAELALGRRQYRFKNHVVLCGLGRLGYQVAIELLHHGHKVLVIEHRPDNRFIDLVRGSGGHVFIADASLPRNLRRANVGNAVAVASLIQDDLKNLEIGLTARSLRPDLNVVLRIFDRDIAEQIRKSLPVSAALSHSAITSAMLTDLGS